MESIIELFHLSWMNALGWSLIHSLWQIGVLFLVAKVASIYLKNSSAKTRYRLWWGTLFLGMGVLVITMTQFFQNSINTVEANTQISSNTIFSQEMTSPVYSKEFLIPQFMLIWSLGVLLFGCRMLLGVGYIAKLRRKNTLKAPDNWLKIVEELSVKLSIFRKVEIKLSRSIQVPIVIGVIRPMILMPISLLSSMPIEQIEAIILHELAHVRRWDYLSNLFQSIIESLLFFNPFVWLMSKEIRHERELCCDEEVISFGSDRLDYAKALTNIKAMELNRTPLYSMAVSGNKNELLNRIKMIMNTKESQKKRSTGFAASVCLILAMWVCVAYGMKENQVEISEVNQKEELSEHGKLQKPSKSPKPDKKKKKKKRNKKSKKQKESKKIVSVEGGQLKITEISTIDGVSDTTIRIVDEYEVKEEDQVVYVHDEEILSEKDRLEIEHEIEEAMHEMRNELAQLGPEINEEMKEVRKELSEASIELEKALQEINIEINKNGTETDFSLKIEKTANDLAKMGVEISKIATEIALEAVVKSLEKVEEEFELQREIESNNKVDEVIEVEKE